MYFLVMTSFEAEFKRYFFQAEFGSGEVSGDFTKESHEDFKVRGKVKRTRALSRKNNEMLSPSRVL